MELKTQTIMESSKVRQMCINFDYCTCCTINEYSFILDQCNGTVTNKDILYIAELILDHSDEAKLKYRYSCNRKELLESICFNLIEDCTFETVEIIE